MTQLESWRELLEAAKIVLRDTHPAQADCSYATCQSGGCAFWRRLRAAIAEVEAMEQRTTVRSQDQSNTNPDHHGVSRKEDSENN